MTTKYLNLLTILLAVSAFGITNALWPFSKINQPVNPEASIPTP